MVKNVQDLAGLFEKLGAPDPAGWARSEIDEGIPQLARFLFLRQAWRRVVADKNVDWIDDELNTPVDGPGGGIVHALERLLSAQVDRTDIATVVRTMQWRLFFDLCRLLDEPEIEEEEAQHVFWGLFQTNENGEPIVPVSGLYESVLETDPTGREMMDE